MNSSDRYANDYIQTNPYDRAIAQAARDEATERRRLEKKQRAFQQQRENDHAAVTIIATIGFCVLCLAIAVACSVVPVPDWAVQP